LDDPPPHRVERLYHWLLRKRVLSEPHFGQPSLLYRLIRMHFSSALVVSLPALTMCLWYAGMAVMAHVRQDAMLGAQEPLTADLFQLHLHDRLAGDWRRLQMPEPLGKSPLPTYGLVLNNDKLDQLGARLPPDDGAAYYVDAQLSHAGRVYQVQVRYRGGKPWHWAHPQKSWKIRVRGEDLLDGRATFNFINTPEVVPFEEDIILDVARDQGLLAPDYFPFRLLLNQAYLGVYFFEAQPDEGLLRGAQRVPGSIYSGNEAPIDPKTGVSSLWRSAKYWTKVDGPGPEDSTELEALIGAVNQASPQAFAAFASRYLDLEQFGRFDALDVVFGCNQHDFHQNHKLYFDPYRGRFEPIAWNFRGADHDPEFNRTENPLLLRLKQLPAYLSLRNRKVYELIRGGASPAAVSDRTHGLLATLAADQARDPYWDAYELLPSMGAYYHQLLRPMTRELQGFAAEVRLHTYRQRARYLLDAIERQEISAALAPNQKAAILEVTVGGNSGYRLNTVRPEWPEDCAPESWRLFADTSLDGELDQATDRALGAEQPGQTPARAELELYPGVRFEARRPHPYRGKVKAAPDARRYRLFVTSDRCQPHRVRLAGISLVTLQPFEIEASVGSPAELPARSEACQSSYREEPGQVSPHPWCYSDRVPETVRLGPGVVELAETRVFGAEQSVVIAPGTTFRLGSGVSLIFYGHLDARGTSAEPIRFEPLDGRWGGLALQGPATAGSRLAYLELASGTRPEAGLAHFPGMVNVHDSRDIELAHVRLARNRHSDDALHVAYVKDFKLEDATFAETAADAVTLEYTTATLDRLRVVQAGGNGLGLTGSTVELTRSELVKWVGSGIVAGHRSEVTARDSLLTGGKYGVVLKDGSSASLRGVLLYRNEVGVRLEPVSRWHTKAARMSAGTVHAVGCGEQVQVAGQSGKTVGNVAGELADPELETLRQQVLALSDWQALDSKISELGRAGGP
jgi:hypothetical protein